MKRDLGPALVISVAVHVLLCLGVFLSAKPTPRRLTYKPLVVQFASPPSPERVQPEIKVEPKTHESVDTRVLERLTTFLRQGRKRLVAQAKPTRTPTARSVTASTQTPKSAAEPTPIQDIRDNSSVSKPAIAQGIQVGDAAFQYSYYISALQRTLTENWNPPPGLQEEAIQCSSVCRFRINQEGTISGVQIVESSGRKAMDSSAQIAVIHSSPFLPLPEEYRKGFLDVSVRFNAKQIWEED